MKLIAFDGDHTLWTPLSGLNLSDRTPTDAVGWPHFNYRPVTTDHLTVERDDGARFALRPEARAVLEELRAGSAITAVISYNHVGNVRRILDAFSVSHLVDYVVAEWHSNKDDMLTKVLSLARQDGRPVETADVLLVDDDPEGIYRGQCERLGTGFVCFGTDISSLEEVLGR